jgi:hypothetical protein
VEEQKTQDAMRRTQDAARKTAERGKETIDDAARVASQLATAGSETLGVWADVNQRVMHNLTVLSSRAWQEAARLAGEVQQANLDTVREWQVAAVRWQTMWPDAFRDPVRWYQRALEESIETTNRMFGMNRRNAQTVTQAFERMQESAQEAGRTLEDTFKTATTKLQEVYAKTERLRAA